MRRERLELALKSIDSTKWKYFEEFASAFLVDDYPELRTTAAPYGDRGRDGEIFDLDGSNTFLQYSVTQSWSDKIKSTVSTLKKNFDDFRTLIYVTNQTIGPQADDLKSELRRDEKVVLDVLDREWFLDRLNRSVSRSEASERLAEVFVDPLLSAARIAETTAPALEQSDRRIALLHLALDEEDQLRSKNLTNASFESLVLSVLHDTSADNTLDSREIVARVKALLPTGFERQIGEQTEGALKRLSRKRGPVKAVKNSKYHLSFEEQTQLRGRVATFLQASRLVEDELLVAYKLAVGTEGDPEDADILKPLLKEILERLLLINGEKFATTLSTGEQYQTNMDDAKRVAGEVLAATVFKTSAEDAAEAIAEVLERPSSEARAHLRRLSDAYTLMAFLRETPDVQKVVRTLFSGGHIWLDASILLPLIVEDLEEDEADRHYTNIVRAARESDIRLHFTEGMLEEVESHLYLSRKYAGMPPGEWESRPPFVFTAYAVSGRSRAQFNGWLDQFMGQNEPLVDLAEYFKEVHGITQVSLKDETAGADEELRAQVREVWQEAHERRRAGSEHAEVDPALVHRLADHDMECTVGVIVKRGSGGASALGYRYWFLTLDRTGVRFHHELELRLGKGRTPLSPLMSPDFMAQYLRLGPARSTLKRDAWAALPTLTDLSRTDFRPEELIAKADEIRNGLQGVPDRVADRLVRDQMNQYRLRRARG